MIRDPQAAAAVHVLFEYAALALGVVVYRHRPGHRIDLRGREGFWIATGLLLGAGLGNKLVFLIERPDVLARWQAGEWLWPGQSIVGGLLGVLLGIELAKRAVGRPRSTGDAFVLPVAAGLIVGRIGCFLAGLHDDTFGLPSTLPWAVDFGDGLPRHPTQLYDMAFVAAWSAVALSPMRVFDRAEGLRFKVFLSGYLLWRWFVDGLKPVVVPYAFGWSGIQWVSLVALMLYVPAVWLAWQRAGRHEATRATTMEPGR